MIFEYKIPKLNNKQGIMVIKKKKKLICSFYKFKELEKLNLLKNNLFEICKKNNISGTIILANEGINGTISGTKKSVNELRGFIEKKIEKKVYYKINYSEKDPFLRLKIKIKPEIVRLGVKNVNVSNKTGEFIDPINWNNFIEREDVLLIDTRNTYESDIGYFKNSVFPNTKSFSEFPEWIKKNKKKIKKKKIAMYCTGGIRCEKASTYLIKQGYSDVFQLEGGILNYIDKVDKKKSSWKGECFVFDERVSVNHSLEGGKYIQCYACRSALSKKELNSDHYIKGVSCPKCYFNTSSKQKEGFKERKKQINLAKKKGISHLGVKAKP